ncbi:MAG: Maf family protein [Actinomycetota bacterium]
MRTLLLASSSSRRAELLRMLGLEFQVRVPDVDETRSQGEEPAAYVERLARSKVAAVAEAGAVAVGADTVIVHEGRVLGKPAHPAEARSVLRHLAGTSHQVLTAVAVGSGDGSGWTVDAVVEAAAVRFLPLTDAEIDAYVATGEPLDKAGSYALQGRGAVLVEAIEGHPTTVGGLPLPATRRLLARHGVMVLA